MPRSSTSSSSYSSPPWTALVVVVAAAALLLLADVSSANNFRPVSKEDHRNMIHMLAARRLQARLRSGAGGWVKPLFMSGEHHNASTDTGRIVILQTINQTGDTTFFTLANISTADVLFFNGRGMTVGDYGNLVAATDFFPPTSMDEVICYAADDSNATARFMSVWGKLWDTDDQDFLNDINDTIHEHLDAVRNRDPNQPPWVAFEEISFSNFLTKGSYISNGVYYLFAYDFDHFADCASHAYRIGHEAAMAKARSAGALLVNQMTPVAGSPNLYSAASNVYQNAQAALMQAYTMNGYADHFLTDAFAAGHVRVPRVEMATVCGTEDATTQFGTEFAVTWMHDEDNRNGLWVTNRAGDVWKTFGDAMYFDDVHVRGREIIHKATQASVDEVYYSFILGTGFSPLIGGIRPESLNNAALLYVPDITQMDQFQINNTCPLYRSNAPLGVTFGNAVEQRHPSDVIRSPLWLTLNGLSNMTLIGHNTSAGEPPISPTSPTCFFLPWNKTECPSAGSQVIAELLSAIGPSFFGGGSPRTLIYNDTYQGWIVKEATSAAWPTVSLSSSSTWLLVAITLLSMQWFSSA